MIARFKIVGRDSSRLRYSATHRVTFPLNQYTTFCLSRPVRMNSKRRPQDENLAQSGSDGWPSG